MTDTQDLQEALRLKTLECNQLKRRIQELEKPWLTQVDCGHLREGNTCGKSGNRCAHPVRQSACSHYYTGGDR